MKKFIILSFIMVISLLGTIVNYHNTDIGVSTTVYASDSQYIINEIKVTNRVNISIDCNTTDSVILCIASYKDNKLIDVETVQISINEGETETVTSDIKITTGGTVKAFVWESLSNKKPASNWLGIVLGEIANADKSILESAIISANENKSTVTASADGSDIPPSDEWVSPEAMGAYQDAIDTAEIVLYDPASEQEAVDEAVISLETATSLFNASKSFGNLTIEPEGILLDAQSGDDFIGVLYLKDNTIYYNNQNSEGEWGTESLIGSGTEGRLSIDNNDNVHVAYTTSDGKIGYRMYDGSAWTETELIQSNLEGVCKWPDIDVDTNGNPHIIYVDTMGDNAGTLNHPDIMYAAKASGEFVNSVLKSSWYSSYDKWGFYFGEKKPFIAMDENNNRYILYQSRSYEHGWGVYHGRSIQVDGANSQSFGSIGSNTDRYDLFGLKTAEGKLYALYRDSTEIKVSEMNIGANGIIEAPVNKIVFTANSAYSLDVNNNDIAVGSKNGNNLRAHYNETSQTFTEISVLGNAVSIVYSDGNFYAIYTDVQDGKIKKVMVNNL